MEEPSPAPDYSDPNMPTPPWRAPGSAWAGSDKVTKLTSESAPKSVVSPELARKWLEAVVEGWKQVLLEGLPKEVDKQLREMVKKL